MDLALVKCTTQMKLGVFRMKEYFSDLQSVSHVNTDKENARLHRKMKKGDINARNLLVESVLPLVVKIVSKWNALSHNYADLIEECNLYLVQNIHKWEP